MLKKVFLNINPVLLLFLFGNSVLFCQAEYPTVLLNYVKINDNFEKIKQAQIYRCTELKTQKGKTDTLAIRFYDNNGYLFQQILFSGNENDTTEPRTRFNYSYLYDKNGKLIQRIDSSGEDVTKTYISYDEYANISKAETKLGSETVFESSYDYDDLSRLIESTEKNKINGCKVSKTYAYDSYNNLSKAVVKNSCDNSGGKAITTTFVYKYDKRSNIIEKQTVFSTGGIRTETFKYDDKGFFTERYESNSKDSYNKYVYTNNYKDFTIKVDKTEVEPESIVSFINMFKYDKFWNMTDEEFSGPEGVIYTRQNIYDFY